MSTYKFWGGGGGTLAGVGKSQCTPPLNETLVNQQHSLMNLCLTSCLSLGADITDFFNYGFMEETWKLYCEKQRRMRSEVLQLNKIAVSSSRRPPDWSDWYSGSRLYGYWSDASSARELGLGLASRVLHCVHASCSVDLHVVSRLLIIFIILSLDLVTICVNNKLRPSVPREKIVVPHDITGVKKQLLCFLKGVQICRHSPVPLLCKDSGVRSGVCCMG